MRASSVGHKIKWILLHFARIYLNKNSFAEIYFSMNPNVWFIWKNFLFETFVMFFDKSEQKEFPLKIPRNVRYIVRTFFHYSEPATLKKKI